MNIWVQTATRLWNSWKRRNVLMQLRPNTTIRGRYKIVKPIGEGSYGLAYLCRDLMRNRELCVLKHVQPLRGGSARTATAFNLETAMLSRLNHPSVPKLIESFQYRNALCFTMEYVPGRSLEQLLFDDNKTFTELESLTLLRRLLDIVADLHAEGIVHRDIRIANVILDKEHVFLIDFGLARDIRDGAGQQIPDDIEPDAPMEKVLRRRVHVTSDFYGLGHLLLFLLYSNFPEEDEELSWEEELTTLAPQTKKLLRRMLMTEQPYSAIEEVIADTEAAIRMIELAS